MSVTHFICPGCGAEVRIGTRGCPRCTRHPKRTPQPAQQPWEHDESYDALDLDLPEDDPFDYDEFVANEFGGPRKRSGREWLWWLTGIVLLIAIFYVFVLKR